jgi:hypothetical protein
MPRGSSATRTLLSGLVLAAILSVPARGGDNAAFEAVLKDMLATMDKLTATLAAVKDEATAKAARPELQKDAQHFVAIRKKAETIRPPNKEEKEKLEKEYRPKLFESQKKLFAEIARVGAVPGGKEALKELSEFLNPPKK